MPLPSRESARLESAATRHSSPCVVLPLPPTNYTHIFGSPLMVHRWADAAELNAELLPRILEERAKFPGVAKTNEGGWHSDFGRLEFCQAAGKTLLAHMLAMGEEATARVLKENSQAPRLFEWTLDAWANVNDDGDFNRVHTHPGSTWSGTYYVDPGVDGGGSNPAAPLHLFDPCQGRANTFLPGLAPSSFTLKPEAGLMVLFPSYLTHMVFPHRGPRPRVSVAFNLRKEPFP